MPYSSTTATSTSASGEATVTLFPHGRSLQLTITPISAAGTATITAKPAGASGFEPVYDHTGAALAGVSLASQITYVLSGAYDDIKVVSTNGADTFTLTAGV